MSGPIVVLDDGRPGREASRIPTLLQSAPRAQRAGREAAGFGRSSTDKPCLIRLAETLSRLVSDADCRVILRIRHEQVSQALMITLLVIMVQELANAVPSSEKIRCTSSIFHSL